MPVWNTKTREWVEQGRLVIIGITQDQHAERCRLFAQWHEMGWPILHDPINVTQVRGVPIKIAIDEHGIVRDLRPKPETLEQEFLAKDFTPGETTPAPGQAMRPNLEALRREARQSGAWRALGDALVLWHGKEAIGQAIEAYEQATRSNAGDGDAHFRLGVCYRMRYESADRMPGDFQSAVDEWAKAREIDPNQYIWRRRIEQYGPRLMKPYPFYDWVTEASQGIRARGDEPVQLGVVPSGAEIALPTRQFTVASSAGKSPDPQGRILRDDESLVSNEVTVVPSRAKPGHSVRVLVTLRPNKGVKAHWNNEAEPVRFWVESGPSGQIEPQLITAPQGDGAYSTEPRDFEFEVRVSENATEALQLSAYALYYVCEDVDSTCRFLRQDISIRVPVEE